MSRVAGTFREETGVRAVMIRPKSDRETGVDATPVK